MVTPVNIDVYETLLKESNFDPDKTKFLVDGFRNGFSLGYTGPENVKVNSPNLKFNVGNEVILWNKVMKEVKLGRYAGPYKKIPFESYIQSPIGLVPKDNGKDTRLIFHLSYPRNTKNGEKVSVNANTDPELCSVKYPDFMEAVKICLDTGKCCYTARSDFRSAFRNLGILRKHWKFLVMKARNPIDNQWYFFIDKALPFGSSVSCSHFQKFSDSVAHLVIYRTNKPLVNYLDDYLFIALLKAACNEQVRIFLDICSSINFPVAAEKTFYASTSTTFLGFLLDTIRQLVAVPLEKITKARNMLEFALQKPNRKITVLQLQRICGFLNFLSRAIYPGRAFTRRLYACVKHEMKPHHHVKLSAENRADMETWVKFLKHPSVYCRSFMDFAEITHADELNFYSDASLNPFLGMGARCYRSWMYQAWNADFVIKRSPSIEYLELFALTAAILTWVHRFRNRRIILFCDNQSVNAMVNHTTSKCKNCMVLIRLIVLHSLIHNVRIYCRYVESRKNVEADLLSRLRIQKFKEVTANQNMEDEPTPVPDSIWPIETIWKF